jgi:CRP-like cAMP-binding protein
MDNKLIKYFQKITNLSVVEINALIESMVIKEYPKGSFLVKEGQSNIDTYFVLTGCIRQYKLIDGNDITTNFFTEEQWIISYELTENRIPSDYNLLCIEDSSVVVGNEQKAEEIFKQFPHLEIVSRKIMETVFLEQQNFLTSFITDKPEQRYLKLLKSRPDISQRVPQYDIASYIGVKPESLSRIRRKIQQKIRLNRQ